ncbi:MAG: 30S ribosomal protein S12 methylthiotransferase RimO [Clostridia bacterium]|nr:30S ribosomal protein S12 methylthiotransferase RimO [Clostridia bacterium]
MKVGFVSLGCSKNLVDTEMCIGLFKKNDYIIESNPQFADIIVINTCGFIEPAKEEAINTILEMAEYKKTGKCKFLIVMGCLVQRYKKELEKALPEVDLFLSIDDYENIWDKVSNLFKKIKNNEKSGSYSPNTLDYNDRIVSTGDTTAYLKIAEGCSNRCTYCAIPYIRGPFVSRKMKDILEEANMLANQGIKEIIVIAQDTTKYGVDIYGKPMLAKLLDELAKIKGFKWIRFLYAYPESITDELIDVVKNNKKICNYFDIPLQHYSDSVLKRMNRKSDSKSIERVINKIREKIPNVVLRTTLIVGFPGETKEDFFKLYEFVNDTKFEKLGVFTYSKEDGTPAAKIKEQVHYKTKNYRYKMIMDLARQISKIKLEEKIGNIYEVIVDGYSDDGKYLCTRSYMDIPNEDGTVFIKCKDRHIKEGSFIKCKIAAVKDYDMIGEIIEE